MNKVYEPIDFEFEDLVGLEDPASIDIIELADGRLLAVSIGGIGGASTDYYVVGQFLDANGEPLGSSFTLVTVTGSAPRFPSIAALPDGGFAMVYDPDSNLSADRLVLQYFDSEGQPRLITPYQVQQGATIGYEDGFRTLAAGTNGENPNWADVAATDSGIVGTIWVESARVWTPEAGWQVVYFIRGQTFDLNGVPQSPVTLGLSVLNLSKKGHQIEASGEGFLISWIDEEGSLSAQVFNTSFSPIHSAVDIAQPTFTGGQIFDAATLEDGNLVFTWAVNVGPGTARGYDTFVQVFQPDGTPISEVVTVTGWVDGRQYQPSVAATADGGFVVAWDGTPPPGGDPYTGIEARAFDAQGNAVGEVFRIDNGDGYSSNALSLLGLSSGSLIASFQDQDPTTGRWATQTLSPYFVNAAPVATGRQQIVQFDTTIDASAVGLGTDEPISFILEYSLDLVSGTGHASSGTSYGGATLKVQIAGDTISLPASIALSENSSGDVLDIRFQLPGGATRPEVAGLELFLIQFVLYDNDGVAFSGTNLKDVSSWSGDFDATLLQIYTTSSTYGSVVLGRNETSNPPPDPTVTFTDLSPEPLPDVELAAGSAFNLGIAPEAFFDPDGDVLALTATLANGDPLPSWLVFDGTTLSGNAPSTIGGAVEVRITASDGELTAFDTFSLTFENAAPVAGADTITLLIGGSGSIAVIDLLANDFDPDGGDVYFFETTTSSWSTAGWDLFFGGTGTISYIANTRISGPISFDYRIIDDEGAVSLGTVTIEGELQNTPPVASDDTITLQAGTTGTIPVATLLDNDFDPDGDSISLSSLGSRVDGWDFSYDPSTGLIAYSSNTASGLGQTFEYVITDPSGSTATATVTVETLVPNSPPQFHPSFAYADSFDDGVLNTGEWSFPYNATEISGYLFLEQYQTDLPVRALFAPGEPVKDASLRYSTLHHNSDISSYGEYYYGRSIFQFATADGEQVQFFLTSQRTLWAPDYDNDAANYDRPKLIVTLPGGTSYNLFADTIFSSSLFDVWSDFSLDLDSGTGTVVIDMNSDGVAEFTVSETSLVGSGLSSIDLRPYGWFTGHHIKVDDFSLTGGAQTEIVTNEDTPSDPIQLQASDPDGDSLTFSLKPGEEPAFGSVSINEDTLTYTPDAHVSGSDSFVVLVDDGKGGVDEQSFTVLVAPVNDPPFVDLDPQAAGADVEFNYVADSGARIISPNGIVADIDSADITGLWNINIVDGSGLISFISGGDGPGQVRFEGTDVYYEGVLVGSTFGTSGTGLRVFFNANGTPEAAEAILRSVAYSVTTENFSQTAQVQFLLSDGDPQPDGSQSITITFANIANTLPNVAPDAEDISGSANEDGPAITLVADFTDADPADTHTYTIDTAGTLGTVINNGDGTFEYDPAAAFNYLRAGAIITDSFTYKVNDARGGVDTATATITITGENDLPVVFADPAAGQSDLIVINDTLGTTASVSLLARFSYTDPDVGDLHAGNTLHVDTPGGRRGIFGGGASDIPPGETVGEALINYNISGAELDKLAEGEVVDEVVRLHVLDNSSGSFTPLTAGSIDVIFRLVGVNDIPIAADDSGETSEDNPIQIDVLANDTDPDNGAVLTLSAVGNLSGKGSVSISGNEVVFNPAKDFDYLAEGESETVTLTYDVVDEHGAADSAQVQITITGANDAPVFVGGGRGGDLDLIFATDETLDLFFENDGQGNFTALPNTAIGGDNQIIAAGDLDGDGDQDLVVGGHQGDGTYIWLNQGGGEFIVGQYINQFLVGSLEIEDFDYDGDLDVMVIGSSNGGTNLFLSDGTGYFPTVRNLGFDRTLNSISIDIDGDGDLDVVTPNSFQPSRIYINDGNGNFTVDSTTLPSGRYSGVIAGDFNGDGLVDLVMTNVTDKQAEVLLADGTGGFTPSSTIALNGFPNGIVSADFNGDGFPDFFVASVTSDEVFFGDGQGGFVSAGLDFGSAITRNATLGDVDGDGDIDIVAARQAAPSSIYFNDGTGFFEDSGQQLGLAASFAVLLVDLDGDGPTTESASLTELNDGDPDELVGLLEASGELAFSDAETGDQHSATFKPLGSGYFGNFAINPITAGSRVLDWTFSINDADLDFLGEAESLQQVYVIDLSDGGTDTAQSLVTITLYGRNDAPKAYDLSVAVDEDGPGALISAHYTDVDLSDTHIFSIDTIATAGQVNNNGDGTFSYDPAGAFEYLALGETATDTFSYTVDDGNGGADTATVSVTVHGENDLPVVSAGPGQSTEFTITDTSAPEAPSTLKMYFNFSDADLTDLHAGSARYLGSTGSKIGAFGGTIDSQQGTTANGVGMLIYYVFDGSNIDALAEGETVKEFGQLVILDDSTGSYSFLTAGTIDVSITIVGVNDAPIAQDDVAAVDEDASTFGNLIIGSDTDAEGDELSILEVEGLAPGTVIDGSYGTLIVSADGTFNYSADADITDTLTPGTVVQDIFSYIVTDGSLTDTGSLTISVTAIDDGVVIEPSKGGGTLLGTDGDDLITGGRGQEEIFGGEGFDQLSGDGGNDSIDGGAGIDLIDGGNGNDVLRGGVGDDILIGGKGSDIMTGGQGADTFVIDGPDKSRDSDTITDFELGVDGLYLADGRTIVSTEVSNGNTILRLDNKGEVILEGVTGVSDLASLIVESLPGWFEQEAQFAFDNSLEFESGPNVGVLGSAIAGVEGDFLLSKSLGAGFVPTTDDLALGTESQFLA